MSKLRSFTASAYGISHDSHLDIIKTVENGEITTTHTMVKAVVLGASGQSHYSPSVSPSHTTQVESANLSLFSSKQTLE